MTIRRIMLCLLLCSGFASASCPICVYPYCGHSNYVGDCICISGNGGCDVIGSCCCLNGPCSCRSTCGNAKMKATKVETDVISADPAKHPWLRSRSFAQDMSAYSATLGRVLARLQGKLNGHEIASTGCLGRLGGSVMADDGGVIEYRLTREGNHWELLVTQFDKAKADDFRRRVQSTMDINPDKEFFAKPDAHLVIDGPNWILYQENQVHSGVINGGEATERSDGKQRVIHSVTC